MVGDWNKLAEHYIEKTKSEPELNIKVAKLNCEDHK